MSAVVVLGATGSIGRQALEVAEHLGLEVAGLAASRLSPALAAMAERYPGARIAVSSQAGDGVPTRLSARIETGGESVPALAATPGTTVVNGIVGAAGLASTLSALGAGNRVALANKESLVAGGELVGAALAAGGELIPVDSEHSAIFQCLAGESTDEVARLIVTASGGPFRGKTTAEMASVTPDQALAHPTWEMGGRITVDSATLVNKGLEVIEAHHLFGFDFDRIDVVVHPQSIVHSAVEMVDGSIKAQLGHPDMRDPIQYALTHPARMAATTGRFSFAGTTLTFEEVDRESFPALDLAYAAGRRGGAAPAVFNAADEVAVAAFLDNRLGFIEIVEVISETMAELGDTGISDLDSVLAIDAEARRLAERLVATSNGGRQVV